MKKNYSEAYNNLQSEVAKLFIRNAEERMITLIDFLKILNFKKPLSVANSAARGTLKMQIVIDQLIFVDPGLYEDLLVFMINLVNNKLTGSQYFTIKDLSWRDGTDIKMNHNTSNILTAEISRYLFKFGHRNYELTVREMYKALFEQSFDSALYNNKITIDRYLGYLLKEEEDVDWLVGLFDEAIDNYLKIR